MRSRDPDLRLGGFSLWVHRWEFSEKPESQDVFDANWLVVAAAYQTPGSRVSVDGPILLSFGLARFRDERIAGSAARSVAYGEAFAACSRRTSIAMDALKASGDRAYVSRLHDTTAKALF
jgi:hypothetical protein